jgi:glycosyltransferase involved in cell wall biosynthesis
VPLAHVGAWFALGPALLYAAWSLYATLRTLVAIERLAPETLTPEMSGAPAAADSRAIWPRVSLIIPAKDEAATLDAALTAKRSVAYDDLEILVVDDRSTDETPRIAARHARVDPRVRVVRVDELPAGWLGKVHALSVGAAEATGDWLLFSDADVHYAPHLLRRVVRHAERDQRDVIALWPHFTPGSWLRDTSFSAFSRFLVTAGLLWRVSDPRSEVAVGGGVFTMIRREVFARSPGFAALRLEVADDVALGQLMKRCGASCALLLASDAVSLEYYGDVRAMVLGFEKNAYAGGGGYSIPRQTLLLLLMMFIEFGPTIVLLLAFAGRLSPSLGALAALAMLLIQGCQGVIAAHTRRPLVSALVPWFGAAVLMFAAVRSMWLIERAGGVRWRDTFYPLQELRRGRVLRP